MKSIVPNIAFNGIRDRIIERARARLKRAQRDRDLILEDIAAGHSVEDWELADSNRRVTRRLAELADAQALRRY